MNNVALLQAVWITESVWIFLFRGIGKKAVYYISWRFLGYLDFFRCGILMIACTSWWKFSYRLEGLTGARSGPTLFAYDLLRLLPFCIAFWFVLSLDHISVKPLKGKLVFLVNDKETYMIKRWGAFVLGVCGKAKSPCVSYLCFMKG